MTMTKERVQHTPGPWTVSGILESKVGGDPDEPIDIEEAITADGGFGMATGPVCVTRVYGYHEGLASAHEAIEETRANARLIAAAPELLEALRDAWRWLGTEGTNRPAKVDQKILAAIALTQP